jgi:opacity protein-like surface antigen
MKKIISIILLLLTLGAYSQTQDSISYSKFDMGFTYSPEYSYRVLKTNATDSWMKDAYDTLEVPKYGYTLGLQIIYHVNKNLFIGSGILFANRGEKTKKYPVLPINNYTNHYYYVDVPVKANYYLINKKLKLFLTAGASVNVYVSDKTTTDVGNSAGKKETIDTKLDFSKVNFAFVGGLGIDCPVTDRWYFKLEPSYRRSITPIANAPVKKYLYSYGINLGFFCKL